MSAQVLIAIFVVMFLVFLLGLVIGEEKCYHSRDLEELRKIDERRDLRTRIAALERLNLMQRIHHG